MKSKRGLGSFYAIRPVMYQAYSTAVRLAQGCMLTVPSMLAGHQQQQLQRFLFGNNSLTTVNQNSY